jgi:hypothetical protein
MRRQRQFTVKRFRISQPQRPPSQHDSVTVWHLGHSRCARTKIGASVVPQYLQRGGSTLAGLSSVGLSVGTFYHWQCYPDFLEVVFDIFLFSSPPKKSKPTTAPILGMLHFLGNQPVQTNECFGPVWITRSSPSSGQNEGG